MKARQPELHTEKIIRYMEEYGLPRYDAGLITSSKHMAGLFEETVRLCGRPKEVSNWLMVEAMRLIKEHEMDADHIRFSPANLAALIRMVEQGDINRTVAKTEREILRFMSRGYSMTQIAEQLKRNIKTIRAHKFNVMSKLGVSSDAGLLEAADILLCMRHCETSNVLHPY